MEKSRLVEIESIKERRRRLWMIVFLFLYIVKNFVFLAGIRMRRATLYEKYEQVLLHLLCRHSVCLVVSCPWSSVTPRRFEARTNNFRNSNLHAQPDFSLGVCVRQSRVKLDQRTNRKCTFAVRSISRDHGT